MSAIPQRLIILLLESKKAKFCHGILLSKYQNKKLPTTQIVVIIIEFFRVNHLIFTFFLFSFLFLSHIKYPWICDGKNIIRDRIAIPYSQFK